MANEQILIIEDNEVNRVLMRDMLRFKGYQTLEAQTAEEGIRVAREKKPALILMDFRLPDFFMLTDPATPYSTRLQTNYPSSTPT